MWQTYADIYNTVKLYGSWYEAWVGEAGGAYNSGGKYVSHSFVNGFWYLDQLGMTTTFDHKVYCRQHLTTKFYVLGYFNGCFFLHLIETNDSSRNRTGDDGNKNEIIPRSVCTRYGLVRSACKLEPYSLVHRRVLSVIFYGCISGEAPALVPNWRESFSL